MSTTMTGVQVVAGDGGAVAQSMHNPSQFILDMVHHNPSEARFKTKFLDPTFLKSWGFNGN